MPAPSASDQLTCSVVVPVRDDSRELRGLLVALSQQSEPPLEIIIVDNASRDDSAARARTAGCVVVHEPAPGIPAAAATGYDAARGDVIVRCDADSRPPLHWLRSHRRAHLLARPGTVAVTGPGWFALPSPLGPIASLAYVGAYALACGAALGHAPVFGTTMSMRRWWWRSVREDVARSSDVHDDLDLSFRVRPGELVHVSFAVGVGMSPRALRPDRAFAVRWMRAVRTLQRNWRYEPPWQRWARRRDVLLRDVHQP